MEKINWFDLSNNLMLKLKNKPDDIDSKRDFITIRKLKKSKKEITSKIIAIKKYRRNNSSFKINFPIYLKNIYYVKLYPLMVSERSYRTEFSLNLPEIFFHKLFKESINHLISMEAGNYIKYDYNKGFLRSRAPSVLKNIIPIPNQIPKFIINNQKFAKEYLKVAFEAEGSAILNLKKHKRCIKLSRYVNITDFIQNEKIPLQKRLFKGIIIKEYPQLYQKIKDYPPILLAQEKLMLKKYFDIDSKIGIEAIRKNKVSNRCGKITARWTLLIYANNINKFINKIGFISKNKKNITKKMLTLRSNNPQYTNLKIIDQISDKKGFFLRNDFIKKMKKEGYISPSCFLHRFHQKGLIKRIKPGYFKKLF